MVTKEEWFASEMNLRNLNEQLKTPTMDAALSLLRFMGRPTVQVVPQGNDVIHANAIENSRVFGWQQAIDTLYALTNPPRKGNPELPEEYSESAKRRIAESGMMPPQNLQQSNEKQ